LFSAWLGDNSKGVDFRRTEFGKVAENSTLAELRRLCASRWSPDHNRLKRFVHLVLRDLLSALHALHQLMIDRVALSRKVGVVLVSFASSALRGLRGLL
jgi:hypothetical protein